MSTLTSDQGVFDIVQLEKLNNVVYIINLLSLGYMAGLAQQRRKHESLTDCRGRFMDIHLFTVACGALEADALWLAIDKDRPVDFPSILSLRENIEEP